MKYLLLLIFCYPLLTHAQLNTPTKPAPKPVQKTAPKTTTALKTVPVKTTWKGEGTVIISIDNKDYPFVNNTQTLNLQQGKMLEISVKLPGRVYYANQFLLVNSNADLLDISLEGEAVVFHYENSSEQAERIKKEGVEEIAKKSELVEKQKKTDIEETVKKILASLNSLAGTEIYTSYTDDEAFWRKKDGTIIISTKYAYKNFDYDYNSGLFICKMNTETYDMDKGSTTNNKTFTFQASGFSRIELTPGKKGVGDKYTSQSSASINIFSDVNPVCIYINSGSDYEVNQLTKLFEHLKDILNNGNQNAAGNSSTANNNTGASSVMTVAGMLKIEDQSKLLNIQAPYKWEFASITKYNLADICAKAGISETQAEVDALFAKTGSRTTVITNPNNGNNNFVVLNFQKGGTVFGVVRKFDYENRALIPVSIINGAVYFKDQENIVRAPEFGNAVSQEMAKNGICRVAMTFSNGNMVEYIFTQTDPYAFEFTSTFRLSGSYNPADYNIKLYPKDGLSFVTSGVVIDEAKKNYWVSAMVE